MRRAVQTILGLGLAVTVVACSDNRPNDADPNAVGTSGLAANADRDFIQDQLEDGNREVVLGRLAAERATNPQVKEFGQMMVTDHQNAGEELRQVASRNKITIERDSDGDDELRDQNEKLSKLSGREFDLEYITVMVDDHKKAVEDVEEKAEGSDNAEIKQWATKALPKLRAHLQNAERLHESLKQTGTR
jgi:putative membrane protein